ncbi:MAG: cytidine deaminase [Tistrella sp.]|nr:cytidine deaminase [Tistrella sp.]
MCRADRFLANNKVIRVNSIPSPETVRSDRISAIELESGPAIRTAAEAMAGRGRDALKANAGSVIAAADAKSLCETFGIGAIEDLMALLVETARLRARPPISGFFVGAVGLEAVSGDLILGGNLEFPGTHLGFSVHGEGFVATRAFSRGTGVEAIALRGAFPCGHCRQYLSEFAVGPALRLIDPRGNLLQLGDLYPSPFGPDALFEAAAAGDRISFPQIALSADVPGELAELLLYEGRHAHAPYSRSPGAVVLMLKGGVPVSGASVESVAFNPTMPPLQAALIDLLAHGFDYSDIETAALATAVGGPVDYSRATAELLSVVAPDVPLSVYAWRQI